VVGIFVEQGAEKFKFAIEFGRVLRTGSSVLIEGDLGWGDEKRDHKQ
jgi:hypothetical protein